MKLKVVLNNTEEIDLSRIDGLSSLSQSTSNNSEPQYGIVPNTGSIDLVDIDRKFQGMIDAGELPASSASADIYIDDRLVQKHITTDSSYDRNGNELTISLSNTVETLNNTVFSGINYEGSPMSAYDVLLRVFSEFYGDEFTEEKFKELMSDKIVYGLNDELYGPIYSYLQKITMEVPYVESGKTYKEIIDEFCAMSQLQMYVDTDGYIKATSARPVIGEWDFVIANEHNQMSDIKEDLFVKNDYNGVEIPEGKFALEKSWDTTVASVEKDISESSMTKLSENINGAVGVKWVSGHCFANYVLTKSRFYTYTGSERFTKKTNNNLKEITKVNDNFEQGENLSYSVTYKKGKSNANAKLDIKAYNNDDGDTVVVLNTSIYNEKIEPVVFEEQPKTGKIETDDFKHTLTFKGRDDEIVAQSKNTFPYSSESITVTDEGETFLVEYTIVCAKEQTSYYGYRNCNSIFHKQNVSGVYTTIDSDGQHIEEVASKLTIDINGDYYSIAFNEEVIKNRPSSGRVNIFSYPSSAFITDKTKYEGTKISSLITSKLLKDYSGGVKTAEFTTNLKNLSTLHGYNGSVGNNYLVEIGDIIHPRKAENGDLSWGDSDGVHDNMNIDVYKTTGFNLIYDGEVLNELELVKVKYKPPMFSFEYDQTTDGYSVTSNSYYSDSTQLIIPESYDDGIHGDKKVSVIGWTAFSGFKNLKSIILPSGIKKISSMAFRDCSSLPRIILPTGLEVIADEAFHNCSSLTEVNIPDTVTTIYAYAFVGLPSNAVLNCNVTSKPDGFHPHWNAYNYAGNTLQTNFIPSLTFELVDGYYQVTGLADETVKHITIPEKYNGVYVVSIADNAFKGNTTIRTLDTGNMLVSIGAGAFDSCYSLYKVTLGFGIESIGDNAFINCEKLVSVINKSTLSLSTGSTSNGYVKYYALDNITLRNIDGFVFTEQTILPYNMSLISYDGNNANPTLPTKDSYGGDTFNIGYNIYKYAFYGSSIESITIGNNVAEVGEYSFAQCSKLKTINMDDNDRITSIPLYLLYGCDLLESFAIPSGVSSIPPVMFDGCDSLRKVFIPKSITSIPTTQFYDSPFFRTPSTTKLYCEVSSKPSGWGKYWNYYNTSDALQTYYGYTKAQYDAQ